MSGVTIIIFAPVHFGGTLIVQSRLPRATAIILQCD